MFQINSLYPSVNATAEVPVGAPTVRRAVPLEEFPALLKKPGFHLVSVDPPDRLFIPILGTRCTNGRLVFPLCLSKCVTFFQVFL